MLCNAIQQYKEELLIYTTAVMNLKRIMPCEKKCKA